MKGFNEIEALLGQEFDPTDPDYQYEKYEWINNLNDKNNKDYSTGLIEIDTIGVSDGKWLDYHNSYLTIPISIFGDTAMKHADKATLKVAVKNSITQLIYSIKLALGTNSFIVQNTDNVNLYNHIRSMVNDDVNYIDTNGTFFHQAKDTNVTHGSVQYKSPAAPGDEIVEEADFNKGFVDRIKLMNPYYERSGVSDAYFKFIAYIPLKLISDFFDKLAFPLLDTRLVMSLGVAGTSNFPHSFPFMVNSTTKGKIVNTRFTIGTTAAHPNEQSCKLWVAKVEFTPKVKTLIAQALLDKKLTKEVTFYNSKVVKNTTTKAELAVDFQLSNGIKDPKRVWTVIQDYNSARSDVHPSPCVTAIDAYLRNMNITVNGDKFFESNVNEHHEFYRMFKDQQYNESDDYQNGSLIQLKDFLPVQGFHKYYCLDISSKTNHLPDPLKPVILQIQMDVYGKNVDDSYQIYHVIEHEVTVVINMNLGEVSAPLSSV